MNIELRIREGRHADQCLITDVLPSDIGIVEPMTSAEFSLVLFPKVCGVAKLSGLVIYDKFSKREHEFLTEFLSVTVKY